MTDWGGTTGGKMSPGLEAALERARNHVMTPEERFEQRVSFVYGQQDYDNPHSLTKEQIRQMLAESTGHPPCANCAQIEAEAYARGCADQHERTKAAAVEAVEAIESPFDRHSHAPENCAFNDALDVVATAIAKMEMKG